MRDRGSRLVLLLATVIAFGACSRPAPPAPVLTSNQQLGKLLFFDERLSANGNQSCAACHSAAAGWTGPLEHVNGASGVYEGSIAGRFSNRKPSSAAYATQAPIFHLSDADSGDFVGGNFWDGRATGERLGNPAADQALGPFLNPVEQALQDDRAVVDRVCAGPYAALFQQVWGPSACDDAAAAFGNIGRSIAAYEGSPEVNQFTSKYDAFLAGRAALTPQEERGLRLFEGQGRCADCHPSRPGPDGAPPLFTDFTFDNIGVPKNPSNPFYTSPDNPQGPAWVDDGLGGFLRGRPEFARYAPGQIGKHRVPTLRNVDLRPVPAFAKCFGHNCYFKDLKTFVHFYNTRLVLPVCAGRGRRPGVDCWPRPEVEVNLNTEELGDLGLTNRDEEAIVTFMGTLSDGYRPPTGP